MKVHLLLLPLALGSANSLNIEDGCEAKSKWNIPYIWNDYQLNFWTPTNEDPRKALAITIHLEGHTFPVTYDLIHFFRNATVLERVREGKHDIKRYPFPSEIPNGWTEFKFTLDSNYRIMYDNNMVLNASVEYRPKSLEFEGSNITINCHSDLRAWKASQNPFTIPLENSEGFSLSFFSKKEYLPTIEIEKRRFQLGQSEGYLTTIPSKIQNLLPFEEYHVNISCRKNEAIMCSVMTGNDSKLLEEMRLGDLPQAVTLSGRENDEFYVILRHTNHSQENLKEVSRTGMCTAFGVLAGLTVILVFILAFLIYKYREAIRSCYMKKEGKLNTDTDKGKRQRKESFEEKSSTCSISSSDSGFSHERTPLNLRNDCNDHCKMPLEYQGPPEKRNLEFASTNEFRVEITA